VSLTPEQLSDIIGFERRMQADLGPGFEAVAQAAYALGRAAGLEEAAKVCEKRAELRFEAHGYTEPDTNASYYVGEYKDLGDSLDEEDADCAAAIRAKMEKP
jgi:hypothetical protein